MRVNFGEYHTVWRYQLAFFVKLIGIFSEGSLTPNLASSFNVATNPIKTLQPETQNNRVTSKTAPARLEGLDDDTDGSNALFKVFFFYVKVKKIILKVLCDLFFLKNL